MGASLFRGGGGGLGRITMSEMGYACFITWSRPSGWSFSFYLFFLSFLSALFCDGR